MKYMSFCLRLLLVVSITSSLKVPQNSKTISNVQYELPTAQAPPLLIWMFNGGHADEHVR